MPVKSPGPQTIKKAPLLADNRAARTRDVAVRGRRWRSLFVSLTDHCCAFFIPHEPDVSVGCLKVVKGTLPQSFLVRKLPDSTLSNSRGSISNEQVTITTVVALTLQSRLRTDGGI